MSYRLLLRLIFVSLFQVWAVLGLDTLAIYVVAQESSPVGDAEDTVERRVLNCMTTATPDYIDWGHRYTYWLSGVAQFDDDGNMLPISIDHAGDWVLTITNSRFAPLETQRVFPVEADQGALEFMFPAVSLQEWNAMGRQTSNEVVTALSYPEATHGLYLGIRNTAVGESPRQLFQVIHYLADDSAMLSNVSSCFVGPRPTLLGRTLEGDRPNLVPPPPTTNDAVLQEITLDGDES
ncbi:MAG: hypothetical protein AAGA75_22945 [Cyanobacteria bacterium P01_E01_bin.6]